MNALYLITARGGSKGIPGKNIKPLAGKPLIHYSIDVARQLSSDDFICVSTDDPQIINTVESYGLKVPFSRPAELSTDTSGSYEVILHALNYYEEKGFNFDCIVLLQPTSPFRNSAHIREALQLFNRELDMVVSVKETVSNPFYNLFKEGFDGFLQPWVASEATRRQDVEKLYEYNGSIYIFNAGSLKKQNISQFKKVKKYEMDALHSIDIDEPLDWEFCEFLIEKNKI